VSLLAVSRDLAGGLALLVWLGGASYVAVDSRRRFLRRSPAVFWTAVGALLPLVGVLLYALLRPPLTRAERRARRYRLLYLESLAPQPAAPPQPEPEPEVHEEPAWTVTAIPAEVTA
jgi:hypothetical protein